MAFHEPGPPDVLQPTTFDVAEPGPGEILLAARAAGVQPLDTMIRREGYGLARGDFPAIPGNEVAGVVEAVGPTGVDRFAPGDEVIAFRTLGAYAERQLVAASETVHKPARMPWAQAGALSSSGQTALRNWDALDMRPGETLLVHAAAGGVGSMLVQIARARGATAIGTASEPNHAYLRSFGVTPVAYGNGLVAGVRAVAAGNVDAALDAAGTDEAIAASLELVADRRRIAELVEFETAERLDLMPPATRRDAAQLRELVQMWERGELRVHISHAYPLREAAAAHREAEAGHVRGKLVLTFDNEEEPR
jgi:enoyl reductase